MLDFRRDRRDHHSGAIGDCNSGLVCSTTLIERCLKKKREWARRGGSGPQPSPQGQKKLQHGPATTFLTCAVAAGLGSCNHRLRPK